MIAVIILLMITLMIVVILILAVRAASDTADQDAAMFGKDLAGRYII